MPQSTTYCDHFDEKLFTTKSLINLCKHNVCMIDIYISVHNHMNYENYKITGLMRLSTRSSVYLRQYSFIEDLSNIMCGLNKRVKVQHNVNFTIQLQC